MESKLRVKRGKGERNRLGPYRLEERALDKSLWDTS